VRGAARRNGGKGSTGWKHLALILHKRSQTSLVVIANGVFVINTNGLLSCISKVMERDRDLGAKRFMMLPESV